MKWFWAVVSSFTQEELARLLQFTTGSSQLPPGGFNTLCPSFQIIAAPTHSTLPTAHTCFNQLCLPTYDSYEELHKLLKLAISEGSEGFGMLWTSVQLWQKQRVIYKPLFMNISPQCTLQCTVNYGLWSQDASGRIQELCTYVSKDCSTRWKQEEKQIWVCLFVFLFK